MQNSRNLKSTYHKPLLHLGLASGERPKPHHLSGHISYLYNAIITIISVLYICQNPLHFACFQSAVLENQLATAYPFSYGHFSCAHAIEIVFVSVKAPLCDMYDRCSM